MIVDWQPLGELFRPARTPVSIDGSATYVSLGVRGFGRGVFHYPPQLGRDLSKVRYFDVQPGRLIVSNIKGWEGAVAVLAERDAHCITSNRFLQYVPRGEGISSEYAAEYLLSERGIASLGAASPGSADRNRTLSIKNFEDIPIPVVEPERQAAVVSRLTAARKVVEIVARRAELAAALVPATRNDEFARLAAL